MSQLHCRIASRGAQQKKKERAGMARSLSIRRLELILLQWHVRARRTAGRALLEVDHTALVAAERPGARLVDADRVRKGGIGGSTIRHRNGKRIAILTRGGAGAGRQEVVDQASGCRGRGARRTRTAHVRQRRKAYRRIVRGIAHFGGVDGADRPGGGRLVRRHSRTHQVRNRDRGDDQDDRDDDQQLNKRETLLLLHESSVLRRLRD